MRLRLATLAAEALLVARPGARRPASRVVLPSLMDTAGNALNLYDSVAWFDDVMHLLGTAASWPRPPPTPSAT